MWIVTYSCRASAREDWRQCWSVFVSKQDADSHYEMWSAPYRGGPVVYRDVRLSKIVEGER